MAKVPHEFKPGEALTAAGLNDVQSQILDQLDAAKAAATQRGDQLQAAITDTSTQLQKAITDTKTQLQQAIDQTGKTAAASLQTAQQTLQQKVDGVQANVGAVQQNVNTVQQNLNAAQTNVQQKIDGVQANVNAVQGNVNAVQANVVAVQQKEDAAVAAINQQLTTMVRKSPELDRLMRMLSPVGAKQIMAMKAGGLPLEATFDSSGGNVIIFTGGAANKFSGDYWLAMRVLLDGQAVGDYKVATNENNSHKALITAPIPVPGLAAGRHTVRLENLGANVSTDGNDFFDIAVLELPPLSHLPSRRYLFGALPVETFIETHGGPVLAFVTGSGWKNPGGVIGMNLLVDGVTYGNGCRAFTNEINSHKAFVPATIALPIGAGLHKVRLEAIPGTASDVNDPYGITFIELPLVAPTRAQPIWQQQPGGLPLKAPFQTRGGTAVLFVAGSGWQSGEKQMGMNITVDGVKRGSCMKYTNEGSSHKAMVQTTIVLTDLLAGDHTILLEVQPGTSTDFNDFFDATLLEIMV